MRFIVVLMSAVVVTAATNCHIDCNKFPSSMVEFSSNFKQPDPPLLKNDFTASFIQHKWNTNVSHITQGHITNSATKRLVRVDQGNDEGLSSSLFDYNNVTEAGLVDNTLTTYTAGADKPDVWRDYVNSNFPIFQKDTLVSSGAVFAGLVERNVVGRVASWSIMYQGVIPVTVYVDGCNDLVGYDYFTPELRTRATTQFFNIKG